ncbi:MAG TPA: response regulator, partial [Nitrospiraceae bacterium]|nr:response regulator [Nitrospiraceae bacterium]
GDGSGPAVVIAKATILIVDDEPYVRDVLEEYFVAHGYAAIGVESALAAKAMVAQRPVDLALGDINLPGEDGADIERDYTEGWERALACRPVR